MSAAGHSVLNFTPAATQTSKNSLVGGSRFHGPTKCVLNNVRAAPSQAQKSNQQDLKEKVRKRLSDVKLEVSPSAYDTAWAAMVPSRENSGGDAPRFQQCLDWVMENQNPDGSWGLNPGHPSLVKDSLSCTLACVLALNKWNVGQRLVHRGLDYIGSNAWAASATDQFSPIGFNVVFPEMVNHAQKQDLILPLNPTLISSLLHSRDSEIRNHNVDYVAEGVGASCNWKQLLKHHQRRNGSLFNSPSTTAAALIHCPDHDDKCFQYLDSAIKASNGWVPTVSPLHKHACLRVVDTVESLGVDRHFKDELHVILNEVYRGWLAKDEEIFSDIRCLAMAFRLLRLNGYDVSSEELAGIVDKEKLFDTYGVQDTGVATCLELYRASQATMYEEEQVLDQILAWTRAHLQQQLLNQTILDNKLRTEVERDLKNFFGRLDRVGHRQSIESYDVQEFQLLKTAYRCPTVYNEELLQFAAEDFRISQAQYQKDLKEVERWFVDCNLDYMNKGRNVVLVSTAFAAGVMAEPELSQARIAFAQCSVLSTVIDDFFDHYGSKEESVGLVEFVKNWDKQTTDAPYTSKESEIMFTGFCKTISDHVQKAYAVQNRSVMDELHELWLELIREYLNEKDWGDKKLTNMEEYISTAWITVAAKLCLCSATYFLGYEIPEDLFTTPDFATMSFQSSLVGRLLNDFKTYKREHNEGALNSVWLLTAEGSVSEEEAVLKVHQMIEQNRRMVLRMLCHGQGSSVPRRCQELMWRICKIAHWLYFDVEGGDQFSKPDLNVDDIHALVWEPLQLLNSK